MDYTYEEIEALWSQWVIQIIIIPKEIRENKRSSIIEIIANRETMDNESFQIRKKNQLHVKKILQFGHLKIPADVKRSITRNIQGLYIRRRSMNAEKEIVFTARKITEKNTINIEKNWKS